MCCTMLYSNDGTVINRSLPFDIIGAIVVVADLIRHLFMQVRKKIAAQGRNDRAGLGIVTANLIRSCNDNEDITLAYFIFLLYVCG